jgi:mRNA interferase MazF
MTMKPKPGEIWLVNFPFTNLLDSKLRPALVIANHGNDTIILGIFSKIPSGAIANSWVLFQNTDADFPLTGLKKTSVLRAEKIATIDNQIFVRKLGNASQNYLTQIETALKAALRLR